MTKEKQLNVTAPLSFALDNIMLFHEHHLHPEIASARLRKLLKDLSNHLKKIVGWDEFIKRELKECGLDG